MDSRWKWLLTRISALLVGAVPFLTQALPPDAASLKKGGFFQKDAAHERFLQDFPAALSILSGSGDEKQRRTRAVEDLVKRLGLPAEGFTKKAEAEARTLSQSTKAEKLDQARALFFLGKYEEAEAVALEAGDAAHRSKPRKPSVISQSLHLAALAALEKAQNDEALKYIKVAKGETNSQDDLPTWSLVHQALAFIHGRSGRPAEQILTLRQIHEEYVKLAGADHALSLYFHNELAAALFEDRQDAEAEKTLREILPITIKTSGPDDAKTQSVRKNLAKLLEGMDRLSEAETLRREVIESQKRALGADDAATLRSREQLALNLLEQRKFAECETETLGLLEHSQRVLGADHLITLTSRSRLARCEREKGEVTAAESALRVLYEQERKVLGADHLETLSTGHDLGFCLNALHQYEEALTTLKPVLEARIKLLKAEHLDVLDTQGQLGIAYQNTGKLEEAESAYRAALVGYGRIYGQQHPKTLRASQRVNDLLNTAEAKALIISNTKKKIAQTEKEFGAQDSRTLNAKLGLAGALLNQQKDAEAEAVYREVHTTLTRVLDEETNDSLKILREIANCQFNQGKRPEAEKTYLQVLRKQRQVLKANDSEIVQTLYQVGLCLAQQGKMDDARPLLEECLAGTKGAQNVNPNFVTGVQNILDQVIQIQRQPKKAATESPTTPEAEKPTGADAGQAPPANAPAPPAAPDAAGAGTINKPLPFKP